MTLSVVAFDLRALVAEINEQFAVQAFSKDLELTSSCAAEVPATLFGDITRIRQVVANLVSNAVKFTGSGGVHIHVDAAMLAAGFKASTWKVSIEVKDSGVGLDPVSLSTLFTPFHQADETVASRYGGTGLGLSISKSLAELMGGQIDVTSVPGEGTTFTLTLPLQAADAPARTSQLTRGDGGGAGRDPQRGPRAPPRQPSPGAGPERRGEPGHPRRRRTWRRQRHSSSSSTPPCFATTRPRRRSSSIDWSPPAPRWSSFLRSSTKRRQRRRRPIHQLYKPVSRRALKALLDGPPRAASSRRLRRYRLQRHRPGRQQAGRAGRRGRSGQPARRRRHAERPAISTS